MSIFQPVRILLAATLMLFATSVLADDRYTVLNPPQPTPPGGQITVREFFSYGCIHCAHLYPALHQWEKSKPQDVNLVFIPVAFNEGAEMLARVFYALEVMHVRGRLDGDIYHVLHESERPPYTRDGIADFLATKGVNRKKFLATFNSFAVNGKVKMAEQMTIQHQISGTPTLVVDGKYAISGLQPDETIQVLNELIDRARMERQR